MATWWDLAACSRSLSRTTASVMRLGRRSATPMTAEWASLPPDLVRLIADCALSTSGVDEYMAMRAVCQNWRSAVAKPSPHAAVTDLRFRPRRWVVVDGEGDDEGRPLLFNLSSRRFRRLRLPALRDYILIRASDGLLFLRDRERPHAVRLLNPLTGDMLQTSAFGPEELLGILSVLYPHVPSCRCCMMCPSCSSFS
uniref:F-box domain-containing protein n=1 Tax=Aegilops tauschii TaxID=37682 RepID=R7WG99_AEGTA